MIRNPNPTPTNPEPEPDSNAPVPAVPGASAAALPGVPAQTEAAPPRVYSRVERLLFALAAGLGVLFAWLFTARAAQDDGRLLLAVFWLCLLGAHTALHRRRVRSRPVLWPVAVCIAALCVWNLLHDPRSSYGAATAAVIPGVLVAYAALAQSGRPLKAVASIARDWLLGCMLYPFSAAKHFFGAGAAAMEGRGRAKKLLQALALACPLLLVIVPLLASADAVFGHYLAAWLRGFRPPLLVARMLLALLIAAGTYSFLWNTRHGAVRADWQPKPPVLDGFVGAVALGLVLGVYALFCGVQFTYLFAGAGLPEGMTYSAYAREGFWQLIAVAGINLLLFSAVLQTGGERRRFCAMLAGLLAETGVMLASAMLRLGLYVRSYGLTWLRLLSGWFILYLAAVLLLCAARLVRARLPLAAVCALLLVGWYAVLGYANPDRLIVRYNLSRADDPAAWVEEHRGFVLSLGDDGLAAALEALPAQSQHPLRTISATARAQRGLSLASRRAYRLLAENEVPTQPAGGVTAQPAGNAPPPDYGSSA